MALWLGLIVMVAGALSAGLLLWRAGRADRRLEESRSWPSAQATVTSSRIRKSGKGQRWPSIKYSYSAQGQTYAGSRITFIDSSKSMRDCNEIVSRYPIGRVLDVWYDPADPDFAVIERTANSRAHRIGAIATIVASLAVAVILQLVIPTEV